MKSFLAYFFMNSALNVKNLPDHKSATSFFLGSTRPRVCVTPGDSSFNPWMGKKECLYVPPFFFYSGCRRPRKKMFAVGECSSLGRMALNKKRQLTYRLASISRVCDRRLPEVHKYPTSASFIIPLICDT